jgi:hypothetical protein
MICAITDSVVGHRMFTVPAPTGSSIVTGQSGLDAL